ncbi:MAG TPA: hypothetical protein VJ894_09460 [Cryomorphaceae bacterium]|nr:hypothetical protein [Cryomorphaceae bacterium]
MKNLRLLSTIGMISFCLSAYAQQNAKEEQKNSAITDVFIQLGSFTERTTDGSLADFRNLAPQSDFLKDDLSDFSQSGGTTYTGSTALSISLGIQFKDKQESGLKANPLLRLGLTYFSGSSLTTDLYKSESFPIDTLVSTSTGEVFIVDSVSSESYNMEYVSEQIRLDAALIWRTNPSARWSLYGGVGLAAGISLNARTEIYYNTFFEDHENRGFGYSRDGSYSSERVNNDMNFGLLAYIPLGVDFRLGNNKEFWKRTHLFYEVSPGINITSIPELKTVTNAALRNGLGLRVNWG